MGREQRPQRRRDRRGLITLVNNGRYVISPDSRTLLRINV